MSKRSAFLPLSVALALGACGGSDDTPQAELEAAAPAVQAAITTGPEANADAVWAHLQSESYQDNWTLWPDKGELYAGTQPHGMLLTTYLNSIAAEALAGGMATMPVGSIIVKENYMPDATLAATTVMYKVPGFDAENNDWWWLKRLADGTVEAQGKGAGCITCHGGVRANDFLWTKAQAGQ